MKKSLLLGLALTLLVACGDPAPRYGEATLSNAAPRLALSGTTFGDAAALELAPGCAGYLDPEQPAHLVHVTDATSMTVRARSEVGPLALAVARGDEVRCDSDHGSGHAPSLTLEGPGDYVVYVAALRAPAELPYTLDVAAQAASNAPAVASAPRDVSVTVTSEPSGASVRDGEGHVVGTTPAMFVVRAEGEATQRWVLDLAGHRSATVEGRLDSPSLTLHAQLPALSPTEVRASASGPVPIRDHRTASLAVDVNDDCAIDEGEVEVDIRHSFIADLRVVLHAPWGQELTLHRHGGGGHRNLQRRWRTDDRSLSALVGRPARGRWQLAVHDEAAADSGTFQRFDLRLTCAADGVAAVAPPEPPAPEPASPEHPAPSAQPRQPRLPDLPQHADIVSVLARLRPSVEQRCAAGGGSVRVYFTLIGSSGSVRGVSASGSASPREQGCVAQAVRGARFPRFRRDSLDVDYTYDLPVRATPQPTPI
jgi:subtilisin-like proprotein convertase family protein